MKKLITIKALLTLFTIGYLSSAANAQNAITTDSILQLSTCAGGNILVPYKAKGNYPFGCKFIAQLSDQLGQFANPVNIGQVPLNTGVILGVIPKSSNFSIFYKIRVIATNPAVTGTPCPNTLIVTQVAQLNQIVASPNDTVCKGDSVRLTAINIANSYKWSTGDTTRSITVNNPGIYSVTTKDLLSCESTATIAIVNKTCHSGIEENALANLLTVYPNPAETVIYINKLPVDQKSYEIVSSLGQVVKEGVMEKNSLGISELKSGIYFIRIKTDKIYYTSRFVKQ